MSELLNETNNLEQVVKVTKPSSRVHMLDVVRGWCMFFIAGGDGLLLSLSLIFPNLTFSNWVCAQLNHAEWEGFTFYDALFPTFLLISGAAFTYSWQRQIRQGVPLCHRCLRLISRTFFLIILGVLYNGALQQSSWETIRYASVLARIGLGVFLAASAYIVLPLKWRWVFFPLGLFAYVGLFECCGGETPYVMRNNWAAVIDRTFLPGVSDVSGIDGLDPEGIVSTLGALFTAYLGMLLADFLRTMVRFKVLWLCLASILLLLVGYSCTQFVPIIKKLWTATYVCVAGGWSLLFCALIYGLTDVFHCNRWFHPITFFGIGALWFYLLPKVFDFYGASWRLFKGITCALTDNIAIHQAICACGALMLLWCSVWIIQKAFQNKQ